VSPFAGQFCERAVDSQVAKGDSHH
jgi:hypothetical protein